MNLVYNSEILDIYFIHDDLVVEFTSRIKATTKTLIFYKYLCESLNEDRYLAKPTSLVIYKCRNEELTDILNKIKNLEKSIHETRIILNILTDCIYPDIAQYIVYNMTINIGPCINIYDSGLDRFLTKTSINTVVNRRLTF